MTCLFIMGYLSCLCSCVLAAGDTHNLQSSGLPARPIIIGRSPTDSVTRHSCPANDALCERDWIGFEAIAQLHAQIDDDHNGSLDRLESDEFIREDLEHSDGDGRAIQASFHGADDFISVHELWKMWITSIVYNWTVDEVVLWLVTEVELPQYADTFRVNAIDGRVLPRLALSSHAFATVLGIKNAVHRRKLSLKASDLVLFGPPKWTRRYYVDAVAVVSLLVTLVCCSAAYCARQSARSQTEHLMKDLATLQTAEDSLNALQKQLDKAKLEERKIADDRHSLELRLKRELDKIKGENKKMTDLGSQEHKSELRDVEKELTRLRMVLSGMERRLHTCRSLPMQLQQWLQLTYEIETRYFETKRLAAETQLKAAKDMCEKLHSQKGRFLSAMRIAHTTSLDDTDQTIYSVRCSLEEVRKALQERVQRWQMIEHICGFDIISNPGLAALECQLKITPRKATKMSSVSNFATSHLDVDLADEEMPSLAVLSQVTGGQTNESQRLFPRIRSVPAFTQSLSHRQGLRSIGSSRQLAALQFNSDEVREDSSMSAVDSSRVYFDVGDDISLTTLSAAVTPDDSQSSSVDTDDRCSVDLRQRRSVTEPSSLADSAISLTATESSAALSCRQRPDIVSSDTCQQHILHDDESPQRHDTSTSAVTRDRRKKIGLSRLLKSKPKDL